LIKGRGAVALRPKTPYRGFVTGVGFRKWVNPTPRGGKGGVLILVGKINFKKQGTASNRGPKEQKDAPRASIDKKSRMRPAKNQRRSPVSRWRQSRMKVLGARHQPRGKPGSDHILL